MSQQSLPIQRSGWLDHVKVCYNMAYRYKALFHAGAQVCHKRCTHRWQDKNFELPCCVEQDGVRQNFEMFMYLVV